MAKTQAHEKDSARAVAVRTLMAVTLKARPLELAIDEMAGRAALDARDRAFAFNLVMLTLRQYGMLTHLMGRLLDRGLPKNATWTQAALITGLAQILFLRTADHAAVSETVEMVKALPGKERGFAGLVNAVMRRAVRERDELLATADAEPERNLPDWLQKSWASAYGFDVMQAIARTLKGTPPLDISLKDPSAATDWADKLEARVLPTDSLRRTACDVPALPGYEAGDWWVQDMAAAIPSTLLGDIAGKHVLDLCAAPGGKTLQLTSKGARVTAVDRSKKRLKRLAENLARTGLEAEIVVSDAATFAPTTPTDHILLDAPCSATGTFRRNPDVLWTKGLSDVQKLADLQARVLEHAFEILPAGGRLVYCVCSLEPAEGLQQIDVFLANTPTAARVPIGPEELGGLNELITDAGDLVCLPCYLAEEGGMDGFYAARLTKLS